MKIIYFGTPEFAVKPLENLYKGDNIEILAVVTQPDKPQGRKQIMTASPVKDCAIKLGLKVIQPNNKKELAEELKKMEKVDFFVVIAYGMILSKEVLDMPKLGPINVHASLLPKYRGASPIQEALLHGDKETGVSIMAMDEAMDHGDVYLIKRMAIDEQDSLETLTYKLSIMSAQILPQVLEDIKNGDLSPIPQHHQKATFCHKIEKEDGKIDFNKSAVEIKNMLRAFTPWPGIFTDFNGKKLKIIESNVSDEQIEAGKFKVDGKILKIGTKKGSLIPSKLQIEGKSVMDVASFLNGYRSHMP
jgi:methionyl-tRNA formyltransferase